MKLRIVDTGYGLERFVWASKGSPTIYDAVFPEMVSHVMGAAGLTHMLDNKEYTKILALNAKFACLMDISGTNLFNLRKKVAAAIDISPEKLDKMITPIEKVYAVVDTPGALPSCSVTVLSHPMSGKVISPGSSSAGPCG